MDADKQAECHIRFINSTRTEKAGGGRVSSGKEREKGWGERGGERRKRDGNIHILRCAGTE